METSKSSLRGNIGITAAVLAGLAVVFLASSEVAFAREGKGGGPGGAVVRDRDNNPPGARGGQGTNWEKNDFRRGGDRDNNPPGPRGGQGTNWEKNDYRRDNDNNPPGPRGGQGSNWEKNDYRGYDNNPGQDNPSYRDNPPGPRGGKGTDWERPEAGSTAGQSAQGFEMRNERFDQFLEKNPDAAKRMDRNGDGQVDAVEKKQAFEKMNEKYKQAQNNQFDGEAGENNDYGRRQPPGEWLKDLKNERAKMAEKGAPAEALAKMDEKIQAIQTKIDEFKKQESVNSDSEAGQ